jgi:hypothetical protein
VSEARQRAEAIRAMTLRQHAVHAEKQIMDARRMLDGLFVDGLELEPPLRRGVNAIMSNLNPLANDFALGSGAHVPIIDLNLFFNASMRHWAFMPGYCVRSNFEDEDDSCAPDDDFA